MLLHPSVAERFTRCAPGLSGGGAADAAHQPAVHRPPGGAAAVSGGRAAAPGTGQGAVQPGGDQRISSRWRTPSPRRERRMRAAGLVCLGAGAGLIRGDLRDVRGGDVIVPVRRGRRDRARRAAAGGARPFPLPRPAAGRGPVSRERADLRRDRSGPPEHDEPADRRAGRRDRAAPAGHLPAARHLAGRGRGAARAGHVHGTRPGSAAPSGSATWSPGWNPRARPRRCGCSGRPAGDDPAGGRSRRSSTPPASRRGSRPCCPSACAPGS